MNGIKFMEFGLTVHRKIIFFSDEFQEKKKGFLPRLIGAYWTGTPDYPGHYIYEIESYPAPKNIKVGVRLVRK